MSLVLFYHKMKQQHEGKTQDLANLTSQEGFRRLRS